MKDRIVMGSSNFKSSIVDKIDSDSENNETDEDELLETDE